MSIRGRVKAVNQCSVGLKAAHSGGQENSMKTKLSLLSSREVENRGSGWGVDGEKNKASARVGDRHDGALAGCTQSGCATLAIFAPPACAHPHGENGKERREGRPGPTRP